MSHNFRKPKPISAGRPKSVLNAITHGLTASTLVLRTESKEKYEALLASYREKCNPNGPIENDLVDEMVAAKWQQRRVETMITALIDVTMDRMEKEIRAEFEHIDNAVRTALAFDKQAAQSATLALLNRYATRHARDYHRALNRLRQIQSERPPEQKSQNEPKPDLTPEPSTTSDAQLTASEPATGRTPLTIEAPSPATDHQSGLATSHKPLATQTGHRPLATDHCHAARIL
jgi:hypothetical protein